MKVGKAVFDWPRFVLTSLPTRKHCLTAVSLIFFALLLPRNVFAQDSARTMQNELAVIVDQASAPTLGKMDRAGLLLEDEQFDEAIELLLQIMEDSGTQLMPVASVDGSPFIIFVPLSNFVQRHLSSLQVTSPKAFQLYRDRVDPFVQRWYEMGIQQHDQALLKRIANQFITSSFGDDALYHLGELALEKGNYIGARENWERLNPQTQIPTNALGSWRFYAGFPVGLAVIGCDMEKVWPSLKLLLSDSSLQPRWLTFPQTDFDLAEIRARLALVSVLEGDSERAQTEIELLKRFHPEAIGTVGGKTAEYHKLVRALLTSSERWPENPPAEVWNTFAGSAQRSHSATHGIDIALRPIWSWPLPTFTLNAEAQKSENRIGKEANVLLNVHPVVVNGKVIVQSRPSVDGIAAIDLHTGAICFGDLSKPNSKTKETATATVGLREVGVPRFTLTAHETTLIARCGWAATAIPPHIRWDDTARGHLVLLDLNAEGKRLLTLSLDAADWDATWALDGVPVTDGTNLYSALRAHENGQFRSFVAAFDLRTGKRRWLSRMICSQNANDGDTSIVHSHNLLTLSHDTIYFNTNQGVIAAIEVSEGRTKWLTTYPRSLKTSRDLNPCLLHHDLIISVPTDCDRVFALNAVTGQLIWSLAAATCNDVLHLLGIGKGNLIASGDGIYWIDARTGRLKNQFPAPSDTKLRGYGRGVLAGDAVYWPTREAIYLFDQDTGRQLRQPIQLAPLGLTAGNLLIQDGVLVVTAADRIYAFNEFGTPLKAP